MLHIFIIARLVYEEIQMVDETEGQTALLNARYGNQIKPQNIIWNKQVEGILGHRSVRTYLDLPLPEGALETMVAAAQSASTSSNLHQWSLVAVTNKELKQRISDLIASTVPTDRLPWIEEASALLLWVADASRSAEITKANDQDPIVLNYLDSFLMVSIDAALAAQNASLAAESIGLGIVYLGMMRNAAKKLAEIINLPAHSYVVFGMAVGHPDFNRPNHIRPRPVQAMVLHHNQYNQNIYQKHIESYESAMHEFRQKQNMSDKTWKEAVSVSSTSMDYMGGRENLRSLVINKGFKLE